MKIYWGVDV